MMAYKPAIHPTLLSSAWKRYISGGAAEYAETCQAVMIIQWSITSKHFKDSIDLEKLQ